MDNDKNTFLEFVGLLAVGVTLGIFVLFVIAFIVDLISSSC